MIETLLALILILQVFLMIQAYSLKVSIEDFKQDLNELGSKVSNARQSINALYNRFFVGG